MDIRNDQALVPNTKISSGKNIYTIKKILGSGSFGITYLAVGTIKIGNLSFEVPFAIKEHFVQSCYREKNGTKVLCTLSSKNDVELSRKDFLTEAKRLQQLCNQTKYIVKVNEAFEANGTAYYVMEYLAGGMIDVTSKRQAIEFMLKLSEAVKVLHDSKVLHMDIKPSNIILKVDEDANELYPVLIDFGITKHFDDNGKPTTAPQVKGASSGYAPVEQYDEVTTFAPTIDIYAMGATLFYMLTKKDPPSAFKLCYNCNLVQDSLKSAGCEGFIPIITKAMAPNSADRFQDIKDFQEALKCTKLDDDDSVEGCSVEAGCPLTEPIVSSNTVHYGGSYSEHSHTIPVYERIYTYKGNLESIQDKSIKVLIQSIIVAQDSSSKMFGIINNHNKVIVPFKYYAIGCFEEHYNQRGSNFVFGEKTFAAPFFKNGNNQGLLVITTDGKIDEWPYVDQVYFPTERSTRAIIHKQTFNVFGEHITIYIQQIPWGHYGITDSEDRVLVPFIYDSIEPFSEQCTIPGPGVPTTFLGAKYTIGNYIGYFKIDNCGRLVDYQRYSRERYKELSILT